MYALKKIITVPGAHVKVFDAVLVQHGMLPEGGLVGQIPKENAMSHGPIVGNMEEAV